MKPRFRVPTRGQGLLCSSTNVMERLSNALPTTGILVGHSAGSLNICPSHLCLVLVWLLQRLLFLEISIIIICILWCLCIVYCFNFKTVYFFSNVLLRPLFCLCLYLCILIRSEPSLSLGVPFPEPVWILNSADVQTCRFWDQPPPFNPTETELGHPWTEYCIRIF